MSFKINDIVHMIDPHSDAIGAAKVVKIVDEEKFILQELSNGHIYGSYDISTNYRLADLEELAKAIGKRISK